MSTPVPVNSYTPEEFEREFGTDDTRPVPPVSAATALMLAAGEPFAAIYEEPPALPEQRNDNVERAGCQMIDTTYQLMDYANVPAEVREIVMVISGLTGGNFTDFTELPRSRIAQRMGVSLETVRQRIERLWEWQRNGNPELIQIEEQEYDAAKKRYTTTKYKPVVVRFAGNFIRRLQARGLRPMHRQQAIIEKLEDIHEEVAEETVREMPTAQLSRRREGKVKNVTPPQQKLSFIEGKEQRVIRAVAEWRDALAQSGYEPRDLFNELIGKVQDKLQLY